MEASGGAPRPAVPHDDSPSKASPLEDSPLEDSPPDMAGMLRRSALRGVVIGVALCLVHMFAVSVFVSVTFAVDSGARAEVPQLLAVGLVSGLIWLLAALPLTPLAFVELRATGLRSARDQWLASLCTIPLAYLVLLVLSAQGYYAAEVLLDDVAPQDALRSTVGWIGELEPKAWLVLIVGLWPLVVPVPLTTLGRLRQLSHRQQLALVLVGSTLGSLAAMLAAIVLAQTPHGIREAPGIACSAWLAGVFLATLLPGAYQRADQLEAWWMRRVRASR